MIIQAEKPTKDLWQEENTARIYKAKKNLTSRGGIVTVDGVWILSTELGLGDSHQASAPA